MRKMLGPRRLNIATAVNAAAPQRAGSADRLSAQPAPEGRSLVSGKVCQARIEARCEPHLPT